MALPRALLLSASALGKNSSPLRTVPVRLMSSQLGKFIPPTMAEYSIPEGSWQEKYDRLNKKYNMILLTGIVTLLISIYAHYDAKRLFGVQLYVAMPKEPLSREEMNKRMGLVQE